jgi:4,5-DOPA dioxygenase extradiol
MKSCQAEMNEKRQNKCMKTLKSLFVSHGAPTYALEPGIAALQLTALGNRIVPPTAIVIVSPHWMTRNIKVSSVAQPETIYDFGGFPDALRQIQYPAPGHPQLAEQVVALLRKQAWPAELDNSWGFDHGAWVPLRYLFPKANIPVLQVSMPQDLDSNSAWKLGQDLGVLARQGVLIIGSGSLTHNLYEFGAYGPNPEPYVLQFVDWIRARLNSTSIQDLTQWHQHAPFAKRAHPSEEHFLPLLIAAGAWSYADKNGASATSHEVLEGGVRYGMLSMESYAFY